MIPVEDRPQIQRVGEYHVIAFPPCFPRVTGSPWRSFFRRHGRDVGEGPIASVRAEDAGHPDKMGRGR